MTHSGAIIPSSIYFPPKWSETWLRIKRTLASSHVPGICSISLFLCISKLSQSHSLPSHYSSLSHGWCWAYRTEMHWIVHHHWLNIGAAIYSFADPGPCQLLMLSNTSDSIKEPLSLSLNNRKSQFNTFFLCRKHIPDCRVAFPLLVTTEARKTFRALSNASLVYH